MGLKQTKTTRGKYGATHGKSRTKIYAVWAVMRHRCNNPNNPSYSYYGGRGITVCAAWAEFEAFLSDMGEPPTGYSLDRIDTNKGYCPENCRWATKTTQARNQRNTRMLEYKGEVRPLIEWAEITGIAHSALVKRLQMGWSVEDVLTRKSNVRI